MHCKKAKSITVVLYPRLVSVKHVVSSTLAKYWLDQYYVFPTAPVGPLGNMTYRIILTEHTSYLCNINQWNGRSQWPRGLRRRSAAARLLRLWVRIPPGAWMYVCCECCVLSGRGLCDGLITRPEESYRLWCVVVCDLEKPQEWGGHSPRLGCKSHRKKILWRRALVSTVMNLRVTKMRGISWLAAKPVSFPRRTLLHGVSK